MLNQARRTSFNDTHAQFRDQVRKFLDREVIPNNDAWEEAGIIGHDLWIKAGDAGLLCPTVPEEYGGLGLDFGFNAVIDEEVAYSGSSLGFSLQSDIVADYIVS